MHIAKKLLLATLAVVVISSLSFLVSCAPPPPVEQIAIEEAVPTEEAVTPEEAVAVPAEGGDIVIGYDQEPAILNGFLMGGDMMATQDVTAAVLEGLIGLDNELHYYPWLITEIPSVENELLTEEPFTITYKLREGITWSDGEPLTSQDIKFTWETIMNPDWLIISRIGYEKIESIETPDPLTAIVKFKEPYAPWKDLFRGILPKHWLEGKDFNTAMNQEILGSGPFIFEEWATGDHITLVKNENYWGGPNGVKPKLDSITFRFHPETMALITMLRTGEVDLIIPPPDVALLEQLQAIEGVEVQVQGGLIWEHLAFNQKDAGSPLRDINVRKAICYAIDRKTIVEQVLKGQVGILQSIYAPTQAVYTPAWEQYTYDLEKAKQHLAEAGYTAEVLAEKPLKLKLGTTFGNVAREQIQQVIQSQLRQVGINVAIDNYDPPTWFAEKVGQGDYEMGIWAWLVSPDPDLEVLFAKDRIPPEGQNFYWYENDKVTELLKQANTEVDDAKRLPLYQEVQKLLADDAALLPLYQRLNIVAFNARLRGVKANPSLVGTFWNTEEWSLEPE
ncbi:peptide/nickel transport system substrate-binding protein [Candidatus Hakubella thermalkaliphila]|uniref:Peptide/nickel transport system substrate-binding protein n=1 Tax=Candidatus Hakubella thermalkaliphila TaxID=2754717 RepID=A0A6V8P2F9_9ACTN|nr:peptide ABC transporter substrate-binding protein [Candidatus Hakubella thermalkaliphila]GFP26668.1 peptide/nickel transport system substrate-binding protein [Candidatus Hakubella thermalkaliphila]GFP34978.1 peptide/nickel transport system substrate-binding protein [Candidatus Hakubella thermalkaliphila]